MFIISKEFGYAIVFEHREELKQTTNNLTEFLHNIEGGSNEQEPHIYMVHDDKTDEKEIANFITSLKERLRAER